MSAQIIPYANNYSVSEEWPIATTVWLAGSSVEDTLMYSLQSSIYSELYTFVEKDWWLYLRKIDKTNLLLQQESLVLVLFFCINK